MYVIPRTKTVFGENAFKVFAPSTWEKIQKHFKLDYLPSLEQFKTRIKEFLGAQPQLFTEG